MRSEVFRADSVHDTDGIIEPVLWLGSSIAPIAGYRFNLNAPSSAGVRVTATILQAGIG
jgi:hypothetical protein